MAPAVFPGSFDPLTNGHVNIVERSLKLFDEVVVAVLVNPSKDALLTPEERKEVITQEFARFEKRVRVETFHGLLVDFLKQSKVHVIIRGLRAISDYDYETQMALINNSLWSEVETVFLVAREENSYISSSIVKQLALFGGDVSKFVPPHVVKMLKKKVKEREVPGK